MKLRNHSTGSIRQRFASSIRLRLYPYIIPVYWIFFKLVFRSAYKSHLISTWLSPERRSRLDRLLFRPTFRAWIDHEYLKTPDPDERENLKLLAMGGINSENWFHHYDDRPIRALLSSRVGTMRYKDACPIHDTLDSILTENPQDIVIQVGSCSGRMIAHYARKYPLTTFLGTDVTPELIELSSRKYNLTNCQFTECPAHRLPALWSQADNLRITVFSSGSLKYVQPEHLELLFRSISNEPNNTVKLLIQETVNELVMDSGELLGSRWDNEFKYTHNYHYYAECTGLTLVQNQIIRPYLPYEKFPNKKFGTVHLFCYYTNKKR